MSICLQRRHIVRAHTCLTRSASLRRENRKGLSAHAKTKTPIPTDTLEFVGFNSGTTLCSPPAIEDGERKWQRHEAETASLEVDSPRNFASPRRFNTGTAQ